MHRTGRYKLINLIFGSFPFIGALSITFLRENSNWFQMWFSIVRFYRFMILWINLTHSQIPLGFGNAVVLQVCHSGCHLQYSSGIKKRHSLDYTEYVASNRLSCLLMALFLVALLAHIPRSCYNLIF